MEQVHVVGRHRLDVGLTRHFDMMAFVFGLGLLVVIRQTVDEEATITLKEKLAAVVVRAVYR